MDWYVRWCVVGLILLLFGLRAGTAAGQDAVAALGAIAPHYPTAHAVTDSSFYSIESIRLVDDTAVVRVRVVEVGGNGETISEHVRDDVWAQTRGVGWGLVHAGESPDAAEGERIPGPEEPESARLRRLVVDAEGGGASVIEAFWAEMEGAAPLIEPIEGSLSHRLVTFLWRESADLVRAEMFGDLPYGPLGDKSMTLLPGTNVLYFTLTVPSDAQTTYGFDLYRSLPDSTAGSSAYFVSSVGDPRNPRRFGDVSVLELTRRDTTFLAVPLEDRRGVLQIDSVTSTAFATRRAVTVYTPLGPEPAAAGYPLLILFDASAYGRRASAVPTPTILDNLIANGAIPRVVAAFVHQMDREPELAGSDRMTEFVADELVPYLQARYRATTDPAQVVIGGSSLGGMAAMFAAFRRPDRFGNVLSQSGAFWMPRDPADPIRRDVVPPSTWFTDWLLDQPRVAVRLWLEVSRWEHPAKQLGPNRQIRDILIAKGFDVAYQEFHGGHDYLHWRYSLADGLRALLGVGP